MFKITGSLRSIQRFVSYLLTLLSTNPYFQFTLHRSSFTTFELLIIFDSQYDKDGNEIVSSIGMASQYYIPLVAKCREYGCQLYEEKYLVDADFKIHRVDESFTSDELFNFFE